MNVVEEGKKDFKFQKLKTHKIYLWISGDDQIRLLKERLEETEKAMKMIVSHMATITTQMPNPISTTNTDNENNPESNKQEIIFWD